MHDCFAMQIPETMKAKKKKNKKKKNKEQWSQRVEQ